MRGATSPPPHAFAWRSEQLSTGTITFRLQYINTDKISEAKNAWSYASTSPYAFVTFCLVKRRDNLNYLFLPLTYQ
jgi:hypothetical protein